MSYTSLDKACMVEKSILLNGLLAYGTPAEKKWAIQEWAKLRPLIEEAIEEPIYQSDVHKNEQPLF